MDRRFVASSASQTKGAYVYVLLLTSKVGKEDIVAGMEAGADDYLQ